MSDTNPVTSVSVQSPTAAIQAPGATAAKPAPSAATVVASMEDLREKAPKIYKAIMEGIAMNICSESRRHTEELKKLMKEDQRDRARA